MNCPSCAQPMTACTLDGQLGRTIDVDLCNPCQAIWFDQHESLQLPPGSTLHLLQMMDGHRAAGRATLADILSCPRCGSRLLLTHDMQRATPFQYWRCDHEHGRFITYFDFLREKNFIRPLSPQQLAELRQNVQTVNCSNCGAPIDLARSSSCSHCGSPLSILDVEAMRALKSPS